LRLGKLERYTGSEVAIYKKPFRCQVANRHVSVLSKAGVQSNGNGIAAAVARRLSAG
jgi:hypothetical protein